MFDGLLKLGNFVASRITPLSRQGRRLEKLSGTSLNDDVNILNTALESTLDKDHFIFSTILPSSIKKVACNNSFTWYLCENGHVYCRGHVSRVIFGKTTLNSAISQQGIEELNRTCIVHDVVCGENHTFFVCQTKICGKAIILTLGSQELYSSGLGSSAPVTRPMVHPQLNCDNFPSVVNVFCGPHTSAVLCADGSVWFAGCSRGGNLGMSYDESDTHARSRQPQQFLKEFKRFEYLNSIPHAIKSIALGYNHTIFLTVTGQCYGIGMNDSYQLGLENTPERNRTSHIPHMIKIPYGSVIEDVKCGNNHTMFLDCQKRVFFCGHNFHGECGLDPEADLQCQSVKESPLIQQLVDMTSNRKDALDSIVDSADSCLKDTPSRIQTIAVGSWHSICTTDDNRIIACGNNSESMYTQCFHWETASPSLTSRQQINCFWVFLD